jgi:transglutaminase-like putative cysteine protease
MVRAMTALPAFAAPDTARLAGLPGGAAGTRETLRLMAVIAKRYSRIPCIIILARQITAGVPNKDFAGEAAAVQQWVQQNIRYTRDVAGLETITLPTYTLQMRCGDCDDHSVLVAALLTSIGHRCRVLAVGPSRDNLQHVFTETWIGQHWVAIETTEPWGLGDRPPPQGACMVEHL